MTRTVNATTELEFAKDNHKYSHLVYFGGTLNTAFTDASFEIPWSIYTFLSGGHAIDLGDVTESRSMKINSVDLTLSAVDQAFASALLGGDYINAPVNIWRAYLDSSNQIIGDPLHRFTGTISGFSIEEEGEESTITVECANHFANFKMIRGNRCNDTSQQAEFSGDLGMEFAAASDKEIRWGR